MKYLTSLFFAAVIFCSCKQDEKKAPFVAAAVTDTIAEPKPDSSSFGKVTEKIMSLVPGELKLTINEKEQSFSVEAQHYGFMDLSNVLDGKKGSIDGVPTTEHSVTANEMKYITYRITYRFVPQISEYEKKRIDDFNDSLEAQISGLKTKYPLSHLWTGSLQFTPKNREEKLQSEAYYKDFDSIAAKHRPQPDYRTIGNYSVFISDNTPKGRLSFNNGKADLAISTMKKDIEDAIRAN